MILGLTAISLAAQLTIRPPESAGNAPLQQDAMRQEIQYRAYGHPPPCGDGYDLDSRDGYCYPNGMVPPQFQPGRRYYGQQRYGRYPVPCGNGADIDVRDGLCYPNGMVPPQFQQGRRYPQYEDDGYYYQPRRRY